MAVSVRPMRHTCLRGGRTVAFRLRRSTGLPLYISGGQRSILRGAAAHSAIDSPMTDYSEDDNGSLSWACFGDAAPSRLKP